MEFFVTSWDYYHYNNKNTNHRYLCIIAFGRTQDGSQVYMKISDYTVSFYIDIPKEYYENPSDSSESESSSSSSSSSEYDSDDPSPKKKKWKRRPLNPNYNASFKKSDLSDTAKVRLVALINKITFMLGECGTKWQKKKRDNELTFEELEALESGTSLAKVKTVERVKRKTKRFDKRNLIYVGISQERNYFVFDNFKYKPYLKFEFDNYEAAMFVAHMFTNKSFKIKDPLNNYQELQAQFQIFNSKLDPQTKIIHDLDILPHSWVQVSEYVVNHETYVPSGSGAYSISTDFEYVSKIYDERPIPPIKIISYDGEMINPDDKLFVNASKKSNAVVNFSLLEYIHNEVRPRSIHTFILAPPEIAAKVPRKGDVTYHFYDNEPDLLMGWATVFGQISPDFSIGFNNFCFDDHYIVKRLQFFQDTYPKRYAGLVNRFFEKLSRMRMRKMVKLGIVDYSTTDIENKSLKSSAYGNNEFNKFKIPGVNSFDLFSEILKNFRLNNNKLDAVAAFFISDLIKKVTFLKNNRVIILSDANEALEKDTYIQIIAKKGHSAQPIGANGGSKYFVENIRQLLPKTAENPGKKTLQEITITIGAASEIAILKEFEKMNFSGRGIELKWSFAKNDIHHTQITKAFVEGDPLLIGEIVDYCIQDSRLPHLIALRKSIIANTIGQANVFCLPVNFFFTHGQNKRGFSISSKNVARAGFIIPVLPKGDSSITYEGAFVLEPCLGLHDEQVCTLDFNSLYPRCMCEKNLTHELYLPLDYYLKNKDKIDRKKWYVHDIQIYNTDGSKGRRHIFLQEIVTKEVIDSELAVFREEMEIEYANHPNRQKLVDTRVENEHKIRFNEIIDPTGKVIQVKYGVLTRTIMYLLIHRIFVKGLMKQTIDPNEIANYDALQNALKVAANSIYGSTGFPMSPLYLLAISEVTTFTGRTRLTNVRSITKEHFPNSEIVYGDTDSVFVKFKDVRMRIAEQTIDVHKPWKSHERREATIRPSECYHDSKVKVGSLETGKDDKHTGVGNRERSTSHASHDGGSESVQVQENDVEIEKARLEILKNRGNLTDEQLNKLFKDKKEMLLTVEYAKRLVTIINASIPKPQCIVLEKIIWPFLLLSKKKYLGQKWLVEDLSHSEYLSMGDVGKKRSYAEIAKIIYQSTIDEIIYNIDNIQNAAKQCQISMLKMINGFYPTTDFYITTNLNQAIADYKNDSIAHVKLAQRMADRDPNNAPTANTRITFVFFRKDRTFGDKKGDVIEEASYFESTPSLKLDYFHYVESQIERALKKALLFIFDAETVARMFKIVKNIIEAEAHNQTVDGKPFFAKYTRDDGSVDYESINLGINWSKELLKDKPVYVETFKMPEIHVRKSLNELASKHAQAKAQAKASAKAKVSKNKATAARTKSKLIR